MSFTTATPISTPGRSYAPQMGRCESESSERSLPWGSLREFGNCKEEFYQLPSQCSVTAHLVQPVHSCREVQGSSCASNSFTPYLYPERVTSEEILYVSCKAFTKFFSRLSNNKTTVSLNADGAVCDSEKRKSKSERKTVATRRRSCLTSQLLTTTPFRCLPLTVDSIAFGEGFLKGQEFL